MHHFKLVVDRKAPHTFSFVKSPLEALKCKICCSQMLQMASLAQSGSKWLQAELVKAEKQDALALLSTTSHFGHC